MKKVYLLIIVSLFLVSCNNSKNKKRSAFDTQMEANKHPGKKLMETNCYTCHSPTASQSERIGPPMIAIKKHYIDKNTTKAQFVENMQAVKEKFDSNGVNYKQYPEIARIVDHPVQTLRDMQAGTFLTTMWNDFERRNRAN